MKIKGEKKVTKKSWKHFFTILAFKVQLGCKLLTKVLTQSWIRNKIFFSKTHTQFFWQIVFFINEFKINKYIKRAVIYV